MRALQGALWLAAACATPAGAIGATPAGAARALPPGIVVQGDAIVEPIDGLLGDAGRGRAIVADRRVGLCLLCHTGPFPEVPQQGTLAPGLAGAGARASAGQLRLRIVDARRLDPATTMPAYYRSAGLERVGAAWAGRTLFTAQQVEDVVAFLQTLGD
jgi:L-cysteine S-thiosulfotransferase